MEDIPEPNNPACAEFFSDPSRFKVFASKNNCRAETPKLRGIPTPGIRPTAPFNKSKEP